MDVIRAKTLSVMGLRTRVLEDGDAGGGDPVVMIHGVGAWAENWREVMGPIGSTGRRAIACDLPGFGESESPGDVAHLEAARDYLDFALSCRGNLRTFYFSHKVAWGAAALARITGDQRCVELATAIADHLLEIQDPSGAWLTDQPPHTTFDQTAEIAIWLKEISAELESAILPRQGARSLR